ncbi:DUF2971 domain-containing protein [Streptomyces sp. NPDC127049]|uniref:DUF2971 domain-containing protein n=1 Tax=Streptomyces sp. NPDC127049 TaxID=3347118 RepID=UPI003664D3C6
MSDDMSAAEAFELVGEYEMSQAPRIVTNQLFHYTKADTAAVILRNHTLRLAPYSETNDLWETKPQHPHLIGPMPDDVDVSFALWNEIDRQLRMHTKIGCLTQDVVLDDDNITNRDALRGWAHLSLWAHYGEMYAGACLRFDREKLVESFLKHRRAASSAFHGAVRYLSGQNGPSVTEGISFEQVEEFGADAVALSYAATNKDALYFRKHIDWASESEYRLILLNQSTEYALVDIREAVTGVILGTEFPRERLQDIEEALELYPGAALEQLVYHGRRLYCEPFAGLPEHSYQPPIHEWSARREGSLEERLLALESVEAKAKVDRRQAASLVSDILPLLAEGASEIELELGKWSQIEARILPNDISAIPAGQRARKPGVPGETVHYQHGFQWVVDHRSRKTHTLTAAAALQVLEGKRLRLHAVVNVEHMNDGGPRLEELWRETREAELLDAAAATSGLLSELAGAARENLASFDRLRASAEAKPVGTPDDSADIE